MTGNGVYLGAGSVVTKGLWHFEGNSNDSSGNGNNGTSSNITYSLANGKFGQGAGFNGTTSKITFASKVTPASGGITISTWFKTTSTVADKCILNNGGYTGSKNGVFLATRGTPTYSLYATVGSAGGLSGTKDIHDGLYHLVTLTWTGSTSANGQKLYFDGLLNTQATASGNITTATDNFQLGVYTDTGTDYGFWNGGIDEIIVENTTWTPETIKKYYTYSKGRFGL